MNTFWKILVSFIAIALLVTSVIAAVSYAFALDAQDRAVALKTETENLQGRVEALEGMIVNVVAATCTQGIVSGHSEVPFAHPRVVIGQSGFPFEHWVEIVVQEQSGTNTHLVAFSTADQPNIVFDGWLPDIRGGPEHIFNPDAGYALRVWRHPYENMPQFQEGELVFEKWFSVPSCQ